MTVSVSVGQLVRSAVLLAWAATMVVLIVLPSGPTQGTVYVGLLWSVVVAMAVGVRLHRPTRPGAWRIIILGVALLGVAAVLDLRLFNVDGTPTPSPLTDLLGSIAFPLIGVGTLRFARAQSNDTDRGPVIDSILLTLGLSTVMAEAAIASHHSLVGRDPSELLSLIVIGCVASWVAAMTTRVMLAGGWRTVSGWLLFASSIAGVVAAGGLVAAGTAADIPRITLLGWAAALVLIGGGAIVPSMVRLTRPRDVTGAHVASRVILPGVAVTCPAVAMLVRQLAGGGTPVLTGIASLVIGLVVVARFADLVWARERAQLALRHAATHDALTGLANRVLLLDELAGRLRSRRSLALIFLDLDGFKMVNDRLGHSTGDMVLQDVARRLRESIHRGDLAARLAGDEFVVLMATADPDALDQRAAALAAQFEAPFMLGDIPLELGASIGVTAARADDDPERILTRADQAMYRAKRVGGGVRVA